MPEACAKELKATQPSDTHILLNPSETVNLMSVITLESFSKLSRVLRVTAYVVKFVSQCISRVRKCDSTLSKELTAAEILDAENLLVREVQRALTDHNDFGTWKTQFGLFVKEEYGDVKGN